MLRTELSGASWAVFLCAGLKNCVWGDSARLGSFRRIGDIARVPRQVGIPKQGKSKMIFRYPFGSLLEKDNSDCCGICF
jgi:hypothetical protein